MTKLENVIVSFDGYEAPEDLIDLISLFHQQVFEEPEAGERVMVIVPERVRARLGWTCDDPPTVSIHQGNLVFSSSAAGNAPGATGRRRR